MTERRGFLNAPRNANRPKITRPAKPRPWSHQRELEAAIGKRIYLVYLDNEDGEGQLLAADPFTLKIQFDGVDVPTVIFKSALAIFKIME
jgi:hypothetical protein